MGFRTVCASIVCKSTYRLLRLMKRGGTSLPGKLALKVDPNYLNTLAKGVRTLVLTGTNGKTTSTHIVAQALENMGEQAFYNRSGANLIQGITTEFAIRSSIGGKPRYKLAVIECDEGALRRVCAAVDPEVLVITNVFRDQLDRYGEVTHTLEKLRIGAKNSPNAVLCLNADDSLITSLHDDVPNPVLFYGVSTPIYAGHVAEVSDAPYCIKCKSEYEYDFVTYGHLGGYRCPHCGYARPTPDLCVSRIVTSDEEHSEVVFRDGQTEIPASINLPGGYNIYNACAAMTAAKALGLDLTKAAQSLSHFACGFGRMEKFEIGGADVRMILIKNPAGCNQVLSFLTQRTEPFVFAACLNDRTQDGRDVSWIWDVAFERLTDMDALREVYLSGTRAEDMALRFLYAGFPQEKLHVQKDYGKLMEEATAHKLPVFVMPTYTAMLALRGTISKTYGYKQFWE